MMKRRHSLILILSGLLIFSGCGENGFSLWRKERAETFSDVAVVSIDSLELAKIILKPRKYDLDVSRDPFKPLVMKSGGMIDNTAGMDISIIESMKYLGLIRSGDVSAAFLKSGTYQGLYRVDDEIHGFVVQEVLEDKIILSDGKRQITLRRVE